VPPAGVARARASVPPRVWPRGYCQSTVRSGLHPEGHGGGCATANVPPGGWSVDGPVRRHRAGRVGVGREAGGCQAKCSYRSIRRLKLMRRQQGAVTSTVMTGDVGTRMSVLAVVPARMGSKGVPNKNLASVGGKPLIAWTLEAARRSRILDRVIVTTANEAIAATARRHGAEVPFLRPPELARDDTPGVVPIVHALQWLAERENY